jgi:DNA-3-methyladenine glycosylase II
MLGGEMVPERLIPFTPPQLRGVGLSGAKSLAVLDLAAKALDGTVVLDDEQLAKMSDEDIESRLVAVRGIGPWTAEVFMMIHLQRLDILPAGDLGIRKGFALAWGIPVPTEKQLLLLGEDFRPYRSVLSWYCWRALELRAGAKESAVTTGH